MLTINEPMQITTLPNLLQRIGSANWKHSRGLSSNPLAEKGISVNG